MQNNPNNSNNLNNNDVLASSPAKVDPSEASALFQTYPTSCGHLIAEITLNDPKALNALSVDMCQRISVQLLEWQQDDAVVAVLLRGSGDKAFCAGGNIRKLYDSMVEHTELSGEASQTANPYATEFFGSEYDLYRQMHFYTKPIILWGNGIIMGGGMGLMAACSHRIVTDTTRFAMPEITIGLFPDATGSWFLQRMPAKVGLFLGLTGAQCNAKDAMLANLAEYALPSSAYSQLIDALTQTNWSDNSNNSKSANGQMAGRHVDETSTAQPAAQTSGGDAPSRHSHSITSRVLAEVSMANADNLTLKPSKLVEHWQPIHTLMTIGGIEDIDAILQDDDKLAALDSDFAADSWTQKAVATYRKGCPVTAMLTYELYQRVGALSLEQILYLETNVAVNCANNPDFKEGVRALLIDKDKNPQWSRTLADCLTPEGLAYIDSHFANPYPSGEHLFKEWLTDKAYGVGAVR